MKRLALVLTLLAPAGALAFVMSSGQVLHRVARHRAEQELETLVVRGAFTFTGPEAAAAAAALKSAQVPEFQAGGVVTYKLPGRCRVELESRGGLAPVVVNLNGTLKATGPALESLKGFAARVCPLLAGGSTEELSTFLKSGGVETSQNTLGRVNGAIAYALGARPKDAGTPSFWVEKERYNPLRLVARVGETTEEVLLRDFSSPLCGEWHPRVVEWKRGDSQLRFVADKVETNSKLPDNLF